MDVAAASRLLRRASGLVRPLTLSVEPLSAPPRKSITKTKDTKIIMTPLSEEAAAAKRHTLCDELYAFSTTLSGESRSHWQQHADTCDEAHVLRDAETRALVGFQLWRFGGVKNASVPVVWGGKLRFGPDVRRRGLHWLLNLVALDGATKRFFGKYSERRHIYRAALVNVHGYQALRPALSRAHSPPSLPDPMRAVLGPELEPFCAENGFAMDARTGRVDVGQTTPRSPDDFDATWWAKPAVDAFRRAGVSDVGDAPLSRADTLDRRYDAFLCWEWCDANVAEMHKRLLEKLIIE